MQRLETSLLGLLLALAGGAHAAHAEPSPTDGLHISLGAGGVYRPEYSGSDDYELKPFPFVMLRYERSGYVLELAGQDATLDVVRHPNLTAGPMLRYRMGRDKVSDPVVKRLDDLDDAVEAGARLAYGFDVGGGRVTAGVDYLRDVSGAHHGQTGQASLAFDAPVGERLSVGLRGAVTYADRDFMRSYYGVDAAGALRSGLPRYAPGSGLQGAEAGLSLRWAVSDRWSVIGAASYERLLDEAAKSPIVRLRGSRNQATGALGVVYGF
jgi:outer membrane scaffolding protein for murein synthesis (MipA/OmpV family)